MDKFVVRTPRNSPNSSPRKRGNGTLRQATLESLKVRYLHFMSSYGVFDVSDGNLSYRKVVIMVECVA